MSSIPSFPRGRGAAENPANRFVPIAYESDPEADPAELPSPETQYLRDSSRTILTTNDSPDIPFDVSVNPYRGCEHGCIYCYARPTHEYLGFSIGLDFETRILVKENAADLLAREFASPKWKPQVVAMSGVTDPYQPVERRLGITRGCLEVFARARNPVGVITKSHLVTRDADLLAELAAHRAATVSISITTLDPDLARVMEPRASTPARRLEAIRVLSEAGVPVSVMVAPIVPGLTEPEIPAIVAAAAEAGAVGAGWILMRLPHGLDTIFEEWLERHYPDRRMKVMNRVRHMRGGRANDPRFGSRMRGEGVFAREVEAMFALACRKAGIQGDRRMELSVDAFRPLRATQTTMW